jgi:hypothetical protein
MGEILLVMELVVLVLQEHTSVQNGVLVYLLMYSNNAQIPVQETVVKF